MALTMLPTVVRADGEAEYTLADGVLTIHENSELALLSGEVSTVTSVVIGSGVTDLNIEEGNPFYEYTALRSITVEAGNSVFSSKDGVLFAATSTGYTLVAYPYAKPDTTYAIPGDVVALSRNAFVNGITAALYVRAETAAAITANADPEVRKSAPLPNAYSDSTISVVENYIDAASVALDETELQLNKGATATLTATVSPENATLTTVTWSSSDTSVATVDENGIVTAVATGDATITATAVGVDANDAHKAASCAVTVVTPAVSIEVPESGPGADEETVEVDTNAEEQTTLTVQVAAAAGNAVTDVDVVWTVDDPAVAALEAASAGATASVSGRNVVTSRLVLAAAADSVTVRAGADGRSAVRVVPKKSGTVTVTAAVVTATGTASKAFTLHLTAWVDTVTLDHSTLKLDLGETAALTPTISPEGAEYSTVVWTSTDADIVSVVKNEDNTATVTAVSNGDSEITVTVTDNAGAEHSATCLVKAWRPVDSVSLNKSGVEVEVGTTAALTATVLPTDARDKRVTWKSNDESIATVDADGVVTGAALGTTIVTVTTVDEGKTAACTVTVKETKATSIELDEDELTLELNDEWTLTATITPTGTTNLGVTWGSSAPDVVEIVESEDTATVSEDTEGNKKAAATAKIKVLKAGVATITATAADNGTLTASCVVTIARIPVESVMVKGTDGSAVSELTLTTGNTANLTAFVVPDEPTDGTVTWNIPETDVARFAEFTDSNKRSGLTVTAAKAGTVTFTAAADNQTATVTLTVYDAVAGIQYNDFEGLAPTLTLAVGGKRTLGATVSPSTADQRVKWTSSAPAVASVNESTGEVEALATGEARITAASVASPAVQTILTVTVTQATGTVALDKTALTLSVIDNTKKTGTLVATITPADSTDPITWESSDESVVSVGEAASGTTQDGKTSTVTLTARNGGEATITVTSGGKSAACTVTIPVPAESVAINESDVTVDIGGTTPLTATVLPAAAANKSVKWSSDKTEVATVDEDTGVVTGVAEGEAVITATAADGSGKTDSVTVKVWQMVTGVTLDKTTLNLDAGDVSEALAATVAPANAKTKTVKWSSSDTGVATVANGVVTAVAPGTATITVTTDDRGKTATCTVTVAEVPVSDLIIKDAGGNAVAGVVLGTASDTEKNLVVAFDPTNATYRTVSWQSSNTGVVTVAKVNDTTAVLTAKSAGTADVTVSSAYGANGTTVTKICHVTVYAPVTEFRLNKNATTLTIGENETETLSVIMSADSNPDVTWASSDEDVATVANGVVTAHAPGTAVITATSTASATAADSCTVTVTQPTTSVSLTPGTLALSVTDNTKKTGELTATILPANHTDTPVWSSSNESVATVRFDEKTGKAIVTAVAKGTAAITVMSGGESDSCAVTVEDLSVTGVSLDQTSFTMKVTDAAVTLTATVAPDDAANKAVTWSSSNESVATVANGVVTAVGVGSAIITVTTEDGSKAASCYVTVAAIPVESVTIDKSELSLNDDGTLTVALDGTATLTATVLPSTATTKTVTWSSSDSTVVALEVDEETGEVTATAEKAGSARITVTTADGGKTDSITINVPATPVASLTLTPSEAALIYGSQPNAGRETLTVTVRGEGGKTPTNAAVNWSSSDTSVVTVAAGANGTAVITAAGAGKATITVTPQDGSNVSATCAVSVTVPTTGIELDQSAVTLTIGGTASYRLTATVKPTGAAQDVTWTSGDEDVATVVNGVVTAVGSGETTITATATGTGYTASCTVTVTVPVTDVSIEDEPEGGFEVYLGTTLSLAAAIAPADATNKNVVWASSDESVVTVAQSLHETGAIVIPRSLGTATITVTTEDGGKTDTAAVTVLRHATGVSLDKSALALNVGGSGTLSATVAPSDASNKAVTWTTSNGSVATVADGVVTAEGVGSAIITATTEDGEYAAACAVTVSVPVTGVTIRDSEGEALGDSLTIDASGIVELKLAVTPDTATNKAVTWSSGDNSVVSVAATDGGAILWGRGAGTTTVTATAADGSGESDSLVVTVRAWPTGVSLNKTEIALQPGGTDTLTATITPIGAGQSVDWDSPNTDIVTVDADGRVAAVARGTATITAVSALDNNVKASCVVIVLTDGVTIKNIGGTALSNQTVTLSVGDSLALRSFDSPDSDAVLIDAVWSSSASAVSLTPATGGATLVANSSGTAVITATANERTDSFTVKVVNPVTSVSLNASSLKLSEGQITVLSAAVGPDGADDKSVTWTSGDNTVATVSAAGTVTAAQAGTTVIKAASVSNPDVFAECVVTVYTPVTDVSLSADTLTLNLVDSPTATLTATVAPAEATDRTVAWSSSNTSVAVVNGSGLVTAVGKGTATITAAADGGKTASCAVTVEKQTLSLSAARVVLTPNAPTATVTLENYSYAEAGQIAYSAAQGGGNGVVSWADNGDGTLAFSDPRKNDTFTLSLSTAANSRYEAFSGSIEVAAVPYPLEAVSFVESKVPSTDSLSADIDQSTRTVRISGTVATNPNSYALLGKLSFTLSNLYPGMTAAYYNNVITVYAPDGTTICTYMVNRSGMAQASESVGTSASVSPVSTGALIVEPTAVSEKALANAAIASTSKAAAEVLASSEESVSADVNISLSISAKEDSEDSVSLDITPSYTITAKNADGETVEVTESAALTELATAIAISVKVDFVPVLIVHEHGGETEYISDFSVSEPEGGYYTVTWRQSTFSEVRLLKQARGGCVEFRYDSGRTATFSYGETDLGAALPADVRDGYTFDGWTISGVAGAVTALTDALLTAIDGETLTAAPKFTEAKPQGGDNGAAAAKPEKPEALEAAETVTFADVPEGHWAAEAIDFVTARGIFNGVGSGRFAPELPMSRAMIAQMLFNFDAAAEAGVAGAGFADAAGKWYEQAAAWAAGVNVADGDNGMFNGDADVTREQLAAMLYRYARYKGYDLSAIGDLSGFSDAASVSGWAETAMRWAVGHGLIGGTDRGLEPQGSATRAQVAAIMTRFCSRIAP